MPNFKTSDGLTLHFRDDGEGVPVLCLSGLTRNSNDFGYITGKLPGVRLIRLDYRGRGRSDWAQDYRTYNVLRESQDAFELMDHLGIEAFAILGTSRGGLNAMTMGAVNMSRILGVAFNDIGPDLDAPGLKVIMDYIGRGPIWKTLEEATRARPNVMAGFANVPEDRWRNEVENLYHQTPDGLVINYDPKLRDAVIEASEIAPPDLWPFFSAFSHVPVALIRGANSDLLSAETFEKMQAALPEAVAVTVADRGHIPFLDEPESLDALNRWIEMLT
jgi:pimeloyl-ACP methyl ester carboxylesterase